MQNTNTTSFVLPEGDLAWERFFDEHDVLIRKVVAWRKWSFAVPVQEDVAQAIRMGLFKALPNYKGESSLPYFIKRIAMNKCLDELRKVIRNKGKIVDLDASSSADGEAQERGVERIEGDSAAPFEGLVRKERIELTQEVLTQIDDTCRSAIDAFYVKGQSYKEIAEDLGLAVNTVGSRLSKCLAKVSRLLEEHPFFEEYFVNLRDC